MGNKRMLNKYKNMPKFNFATVGIAIGIGLIVLLLVFFFKITFEEPNVNVVGSVEKNSKPVVKSAPAKVVVKPEKKPKPAGVEKKSKESSGVVILTPPQESAETSQKVASAEKKQVSKPAEKKKTVVEKERQTVKPKAKPSVKRITGKVVYVIQIGSFRDKKRAILLKKEMVKRGYKVKIVKGVVKGKVWYRVRVGSGSTKSFISEMIERLKKEKVFGMKLKPIVMR